MPGQRAAGGRLLRRAGILVAASAGLLTAACSSPGSSAKVEFNVSAPPASPSAGPTAAAALGPLAPLTGLPASPAAASRRAVALVIAGRHPHQLSAADVIFEEITSPRRYIAVFQSRQANAAGPITSTQPTDGQVLSVLRPVIGYNGGTASFIKVLDHTKVADLGHPVHRWPYHSGARGLTASTKKLRDLRRGPVPPELLTYRGAGSGSKDLATKGEWRPSSVTVAIPGHGKQHWIFDARTDRWAQVSGGPPIQVANLIVQTVHYKKVFLSRRFGISVPSARVLGRGQAEVFSGIGSTADRGQGGLAAKGRWSKPILPDITNYVDSAGFPMAFQPGPTWIILAPHGTRVRTAEARS
jgi:Protein of unknown function (DUF3048) N-terminal domain/Protein of unknown function (DUF3048) C-terminal domain